MNARTSHKKYFLKCSFDVEFINTICKPNWFSFYIILYLFLISILVLNMHRISSMSLIIAQYFNFIVHVCMCMHGTITLFKRYTFIRNFWQLIWRFLDQGVSSFDAISSEILSYLKITKHTVRCSINNESGRSCNQEFFRSIGCAMNTWLKYL